MSELTDFSQTAREQRAIAASRDLFGANEDYYVGQPGEQSAMAFEIILQASRIIAAVGPAELERLAQERAEVAPEILQNLRNLSLELHGAAQSIE